MGQYPREEAGGFKSRIRSPYPQRVVKSVRCVGITWSESPYKKVSTMSVKDGHVKEPCEMSMALEAKP